jgi:hypothetical protein
LPVFEIQGYELGLGVSMPCECGYKRGSLAKSPLCTYSCFLTNTMDENIRLPLKNQEHKGLQNHLEKE